MQNQTDPIERAIVRRDGLLAESGEHDKSHSMSAVLNWSLGLVRLCTLIYCLFVACSQIYVLIKSTLNPIQIYNIIFELLICDFVIHDALAAGGWMPGVSNSLFLIRIAKLIPYYSRHEEYQYYTSIPKNYLRAVLFLFVASINNSHDIYMVLLHNIRILNIALIVFGLLFILIGYIGAIKGKYTTFCVDWILESNKNMETQQGISYESNTWCGWISMVFDISFLLFIIAVYLMIVITTFDSLDLFVFVSCIAKCLLSVLIITYLIIHRRAVLEVNWCSIFIMLFALNAAINVQYDFVLETPININEYCLYIWFILLFIEFIRFIVVIIMYFLSMYRYYTPFKFMCVDIAEWTHFWIIKQGFTKMGLILVMFALPFLLVSISSDWFLVDMHHTPFFDYESPLNLKQFNIEKYLSIFEDIWDEVGELVDAIGWTDIPDAAMCTIIVLAFAAVVSAGVAPFAGSAAAIAYKFKRIYKMVKRLAEMFKKIYDTVKSLLDKIRAIINKVKAMLKRVKQFVDLLNRIKPKYIGLSSVAGLFGLILIPSTTVIIVLYFSFFDRTLRFNNFQISAHTRHWVWLLFILYLLLLNIANLLVIMSLHKLLTDIFVFETVVFESKVLYLDGYRALFIVHILIIVGLSLFIFDRLFLKYCNKTRCYTWSKTPNDMILHSFCKCKPHTPCMQSMISYLVEYYQWHDAETMTYDQMCSCIMHMDQIQKENEKVIENMLNTCWSCIKYNRFNDNHTLSKKEWEYFLTSYKLGSFPWTQPASVRNMVIQNQLKHMVDTLYNENDYIEYKDFHEYTKHDISTLNVEGCKQMIAHLRSLLHHDLGIDIKLLSDNDLGVKLLLNLSKAQLNHLLTRFDKTAWHLITAIDVIHDTNDTDDLQQNTTEYQDNTERRTQSEIEMNEMSNLPPGWRRIRNEEGLVYYHNDELKKTQWDVPTVNEEEEIQEEEEEEEDALPTGWDKFVNEEGIGYYHNPALKETQWERPQAIQRKDEEENEEEDDAKELPEFWRMITHNAENVYYHNEKTGKTQWDRPKEEVQTPIVIEEKEEQPQKESMKDIRHVATQTTISMNGVFERKVIYHLFFKIAMNDLLMQNNICDKSKTDVSIEEEEVVFIDLIDNEWIMLNKVLLLKLNIDHGHKEYAPNKFAAETVLEALHDEERNDDILIIASQNGMKTPQKWFKYLENALIEYNNNNTQNDLILIFPLQQHYETWCIYVVLSLLLSIHSVYTLVSFEFMSMKYQPTLELVNKVSALVKAKESVVSEWDVDLNFDSYFDFHHVSDQQFYDCDIGSLLMYLPINPLNKFNSFGTFLSSMMDGFTMDDISLIELLDELDLYGELGIDGNIDLNSLDLNNLDLESLVLHNLDLDNLDIDNLDIDSLNLESLGIGDIEDLVNVDWANLDIDNIDFGTLESLGIVDVFIQFPMISLNTWPSITISFYAEWFLIILFGPIFSLILILCVFFAGCKVKSIEINKQLIGVFVIFGGFCGLEFVLSLGSILSVITKYLPHSLVEVKYEYGYYNLILCNIFVMLMGLLIFVDAIAGEHIPLLSRIFKKNSQHSHSTAPTESVTISDNYAE